MRASWLALGLLMTACGSPRPATAIMLSVTADEAVRTELSSLRIRVLGGPDAANRTETFSQTETAASLRWPVDLGIVPREGDASRTFEIEIAVLDRSGGTLLTNRVASSFVTGEVRVLRVHLAERCLRILCEGATSCAAGICQPIATVDPRDLPPLDGGVGDDAGAVDAGTDARVPYDSGPADGGDDFVVLTVQKAAGTGTGTLTSDAGPTCAAECSSQQIRVRRGTTVNLLARPDAGSYFYGWTGVCTGVSRFCSVVLNDNQTLSAQFEIVVHNLVFATSERFAGDFGGIAAADGHCERLARGVGLSGTFVAMLSQPGTNAIDRLVVPETTTPARGFVRMDGKPIADTVQDLTINRRILYPIHFDENGAPNDSYTWSGSLADGTVSTNTCNAWTSREPNPDIVRGEWGDSGGGPQWLEYFNWTCADQNVLVCVQIDHDVSLAPPPAVQGKRMWLSRALFAPGAGGILAANTLCNSERPTGVASARALLATTSASAASLLAADVLYVRPDGIPIGTRDEFVAGTLRSGNWVHADGSYDFISWAVWAGSAPFSAPAASGLSNCDNWSSSAPTASLVGGPTSTGAPGSVVPNSFGWWGRTETSCMFGQPIMCFEE